MNIKIDMIGNGFLVININEELKIGFDPMLAEQGRKYIYKGLKTSRVVGAEFNPEVIKNVKNWFVGHGHFDHIDKEGLAVLDKDVNFIAEQNCVKEIKKWNDNANIKVLSWDETTSYNENGYEINVRATNAYHGNKFLAGTLMGKVNGYIIKVSKDGVTKTIWHTGDTVFDNRVIESVKNESIDFTIAIMGNAKSKMPNGPFTMNVDMLNNFIKTLKLNKDNVLPIHMNDFAHFEDDPQIISKLFRIVKNGESISFDV